MTIVEELRQNKESGAKRLESEYKAGLMSLARRFCDDPSDAEELVNRTFAAVVEGIDDYLEQSAFFGWMCQILTNLHGMDVRRKANRDIIYPGDVPDLPDETATDRIYDDIDASLLRDTIQRLPKEQRELLLLHYFMDMPIAKIAKFLSIPSGTVRSRLYYARKALAAKLGVAAHKPGVKTLLIVLALCGLTALGAAVYRLGWGEPSRRADNVSTTPTSSQAGISGISGISGTSGTSGASGVPGVSKITGVSNGNAPLNFQLFSLSTEPPTQGDNTMNTRKFLASAAAIALASSAPLAASANELHLMVSDKSSKFGETSFNYWNCAGGGTDAPNPDHDYVVDGGLSMRFPDGSYQSSTGWVWPGNSLRIGTVGTSSGTLVLTRNASSKHTFNNGGLILAKGRIQPWVGNYTQTFTGTITVTAPESDPFDVMLSDTANHPNQTFAIGGTLKGEAGTALRFYANTAGYPAQVNFAPSKPDAFAGKIILGNGDANKQISCDPQYNKTMAGGFVVTKGSSLAPQTNDKKWTVGSLEIQNGGSFVPPNSGTKWSVGDMTLASGSTLLTKLAGEKTSTITLTNSLTTAYPVNLTTPDARTSTANTSASASWSVLTLPTDKGDLGDNVGDFVLATQPSIFPDSLPAVYLAVTTNEAGTVASLDLVQRQIVRLVGNNPLSDWRATGFATAVTNADSWSDSAVPHSGADYVVDSKDMALCLPPQELLPGGATYEFPGDSLTLGAGNVNLYSAADTTRIPILRMVNDARYWPSQHFGGSAEITLEGDAIHLLATGSGQSYFRIYGDRLYRVKAPLSGEGRLTVFNNSASGSKPSATILFDADNSAFKGRIRLSGSAGNYTSDYANTLLVENAAQLGGPLDAFAYDALELRIGSTLAVTNDVDLSTANRGLYVYDSALANVADGATLTLGNAVSFGNGATLTKAGAGTLALGDKVANLDDAAGTIEVNEGYLKALSTNAVNGVSVSFADGAYLLVDPAPADDDLAQFGAVDLSASPFGGDLPVAFDLPPLANESDSYRYADIAVATVKDAATASALDLSAKKIKGHGVTFTTRENTDGTVTILASIGQNSFVMVVR